MRLSEIKQLLPQLSGVSFQLPDGSYVPEHFHVTEVGIVTKHFIDCGGVVRHEKTACFQLWNADDYEHRLKPGKLLHIIDLSEKTLGMEDLDIEVEYQSHTIGRYDLDFDGTHFLLLPKHTACLASDQCGISPEKQPIQITDLTTIDAACCTPGGGCC
jgi:hypothetical protein